MLSLYMFLTSTCLAENTSNINLSYGILNFVSGGSGSYFQPGNQVAIGYSVGNKVQYGLQISQSVHNGDYYDQQLAVGCSSTQTCIQGDSNILSIGGVLKLNSSIVDVDIIPSLYYIPVLMDPTYYEERIVSNFGYTPSIHEGVKPGGSLRLSFNKSGTRKSLDYGIYLSGRYILDVGMGYGFGILFQSR